jgi:predicted porin
MKKHLIAAAVAAAVAGPAAAQSVSISGVLDVRATNNHKATTVTSAGASSTVKDSGSTGLTSGNAAIDGWATSALGFTMSEDLGGGLKATAHLLQRMGNTLEARERWIELAGNFGAVRVGRVNPSLTANYVGISGLGTTNNAGSFYQLVAGGGRSMSVNANTAAFASGNMERQDGVIQYTSPRMSGFQVAGGIADNSSDASALDGKTENKQQYATVSFASGPLAVGAGWAKRDRGVEAVTGVAALENSTTTAQVLAVTATNREGKMTWLGASYDLGMARVHVTTVARDEKQGNLNAALAQTNDISVNTVALSVPLGAATLRGSFYDGRDEGTTATTTGHDLSGYQLSMQYAFSKRTSAYLVTGINEKKRKGGSTADNIKEQGTGIGLVHSF